MKYTKGKWKWKWEKGQPIVRAHDPKDPLKLIATVYPKIGRKVFAPIDEAEANAHLIAAAPDMYEALKLYQEHQKDTSGHYCYKCAEAINASIDKAEGR